MADKALPLEGEAWPGFYAPLYTQVPDELFDYWLSRLSGAELKVLLYIIRRTFGFKKTADDISHGQMVHGIKTRDGRHLDYGAGVGETAIKGAIRGLVDKGLIDAQHNYSPGRGNEPTTYRLRMRATPDAPYGENRPRPAALSDPGGGSESAPGLGHNLPPQETVQETVNKNGSAPHDKAAERHQLQAQIKRDRPTLPPGTVAVILAAWATDDPPDWLAWWQAHRWE